jgi:hypothetical protein
MRRLIAAAVLVALLVGVVWTPAAYAGKSTDIALGLASFAVFNQVVAPLLHPHRAEAGYHRHAVVHRTVVTRPVVYSTPVYVTPVYATPAPAVVAQSAYPTVIHYPHGRYELRLHGHQYLWVWIPAVPAPPPPPPAQ